MTNKEKEKGNEFKRCISYCVRCACERKIPDHNIIKIK